MFDDAALRIVTSGAFFTGRRAGTLGCMIRREAGDTFVLFTQHDHAVLAGQLARHFGNERFGRPKPYEQTMIGVSMHDSGWPLHDDRPTLNPKRLPLDVFESPREIALAVWTASAERAAAADPYAGLLTSLHVLALSVFATTQTPFAHEKFDTKGFADKFEINKFQHCEIERQESLRRQLGLRTDLPLQYGVAEASSDPREQELLFNFRLLQGTDQISLGLCCTEPPMKETLDLYFQPGGKKVKLAMKRLADETLTIKPWPFDASRLEFEIAGRRIARRAYADAEEFRECYHRARLELYRMRLASLNSSNQTPELKERG